MYVLQTQTIGIAIAVSYLCLQKSTVKGSERRIQFYSALFTGTIVIDEKGGVRSTVYFLLLRSQQVPVLASRRRLQTARALFLVSLNTEPAFRLLLTHLLLGSSQWRTHESANPAIAWSAEL